MSLTRSNTRLGTGGSNVDIYRLDSASFLPNKLIEGGEKGYTSMIWTERYIEPGEFELKTPFVLRTQKQLPRGALISHRDTLEVMEVETHSISVTTDGVAELTVKGRSLDYFAKNRILEGPYPKKKYKMARSYTAHEAALVLLWNAFVNTTAEDVTRAGPWERDILDTIPNTVVTDSTTIAGSRKKRWLEGGQVGPQLITLLNENKVGFRTIRPISGGTSGKIARITKSAIADDSGVITYTDDTSINALRWDLYNGADRRRQGPSGKEVIFNYDSGHIEDPNYLFSNENYMTMAFVISSSGVKKFYRDRATERNLAGLQRRVLWVDGGEIELKEVPDDKKANESDSEFQARKAAVREENDATREEFKEDLDNTGSGAIEKADEVLLMDGKILPDCPYRYKRDYNLGDKVTMVGQYEFDQTMRVSEYVRTEDRDGDRGFPGLVVTL